MTVLTKNPTGYDMLNTGPLWNTHTAVDTVNFAYSSGAATGVAQTDILAGNCQPIIWTGFDFASIPLHANITDVSISILSVESADPALSLVGSTTWELRNAAGDILLTKQAPFSNGVTWSGGDTWNSLTASDFAFTEKGHNSLLKIDKTRFTKADLVDSTLMWTVNNETEDAITSYNYMRSFVDKVAITVTYDVPDAILTGYLDRRGRPTGTGLTICDNFVMNPASAPGNQDGIQWDWIMNPATQAVALQAMHDELDWAESQGLFVKLRIFNPPYIPSAVPPVSHDGSGRLPTEADCTDWAKQQFNTAGYTIPNVRYWHHPDYISAYAALQAKLADEFDDRSYLRDVAFCGGILDFAEPMVRQTGNIDSKRSQINTWQAAGSPLGEYFESDMAALMEMMNAHTVWTKTRQSLACNPYQRLRLRSCGGLPKYAGAGDVARTRILINHWCDILGPLAVVGNNSIRPISPDPTATYDEMYNDIVTIAAEKGATVYFQTAGTFALDQQFGNVYEGVTLTTRDEVLDATIDRCGEYGATYIELPGHYKDAGITIPPFPS